MRNKLRWKKGETLVEVMVSLLIAVLIISMLPMALETAARINASVGRLDTICQRTMAEGSKVNVTAGIYNSTGTLLANLDVQGYSENGFTYYVGK